MDLSRKTQVQPRDGARAADRNLRTQIHRELRQRFGMQQFRPGQEDIILKVLSGRNVLAIYPAGYGKSLLYQLPAALLSGTTLVFSPLVALMHDQQATLTRRFGIPSVALTHVLLERNPRQFFAGLDNVRRGHCKVVFIAPEKLDNDRVMDALRARPVSMLVLDEAHCISVWGHDFRPHYRRLLRFVAEVKPSAVLALTATAPPAVAMDILHQIGGPTDVFRISPHIPNLRLHVFPVESVADKLSALARLVPRLPGNGIVYCGTHEECEDVAEFLKGTGIESAFYHAGLGARRREIERDFLANRWKVVAATCALGMGIDKRDVRFVIHYRFPGSPELYYQEIGRAGRDGRRAECILLFDPADRALQDFFLNKSNPQPDDYMAVYSCLDESQPKTAEAIAAEMDLSRACVEIVLENLADSGLAQREKLSRTFAGAVGWRRTAGRLSHTAIEPFLSARRHRAKALDAMVDYGQTTTCLMAYLCRYLGDSVPRPCGLCTHCGGLAPSYEKYREVMPEAEKFVQARLPRLEACSDHDGGYALDYHGGTAVGDAVSRAKYARKRPRLPEWLVERAADCILEKYLDDNPHALEALTFIPSNSDCSLVRDLAQRLAERLHLPCVDLLTRARPRDLQKDMKTREEKRWNISGAFALAEGVELTARRLLLIDDVFDSGWTFREAARVIRQAFPDVRIRIFVLTRTQFSDEWK